MSKANTMPRVTIAALALAGLATVSCVKQLGGGSGPSSGDNTGVTATDPGSGSMPAPSAVPAKATRILPVATGMNAEVTPTPIEAPVTLPSPAVLEAVNAVQGKLTDLATGIEGTKVKFVDCNESASCTTRLEAKTLTGLRDLLQAVNKQQGGISFVAREQLDAYTGQTFVADVTLGGDGARPVPSDENELLVN